MPAKQRPTLISVFGILLIVYGSFLLATAVCCGVPGLVAGQAFSQMAIPQGQGKAPVENPLNEINAIPGMLAYQVAGLGMNMVLGGLLVAAGIGFLKMRQWGRHLGIAFALVGLIWAGIGAVIQQVYINPRMVDINKKIQSQMGQSNPLIGNPTFTAIITAFGLVFAFGGPIVVLVMMLLPPVKRGLAGLPEPEWEAGPDAPNDGDNLGETIRQ
jgi:hypothetical protein